MITKKDLKEFGFVTATDTPDAEMGEEARGAKEQFTGYPASLRRYRLFVEAHNMSIEEPYFWVKEYLQQRVGFPGLIKITDVFSASENSSFFGASQQRLGLQQDKVSQYLATIGKMVKELFQLIRELRILDERLGYYADSFKPRSNSRGSAEITLKGIWVDMVEQGAKNPASVYGMAREVQFITLPDLFFNIHPFAQEDVDDTVEREAGQFNKKVREVLKRKLRSYLAWKEHTYEEMKNRRIFTLKYLRQHYEIIKMYLMWVKPYLKNIERLTMDTQKMDSPDLLNAFETSVIEVELLATKEAKGSEGELFECILCSFYFRTRPEMNYQQEYQRGPIHVGRVEMNFRGYIWSPEQIEKYQKLRDREDFKLLGIVDGSVKAAMESLGDEMERYLREAGDDLPDKKKAGGEEHEDEHSGGHGGGHHLESVESGSVQRFSPAWKSVRQMLESVTHGGHGADKKHAWHLEKVKYDATDSLK
ncbi:MAG: hypothetical protein Q7S65_03430, partial [Nanoarchaeota archaeon]|nr:hypothetical protein [Nanoarchaeota archaeon]